MNKTGHSEPRAFPIMGIVACIVLVIVAIIGQTWWSIRDDHQQSLRAAREQQLIAVRLLEERAARVLGDAVHALAAASEDLRTETRMNAQDKDAIEAILANQRQDTELLRSIELYDPQGARWAQSGLRFPVWEPGGNAVQFLVENPGYTEAVLGAPFKAYEGALWLLPVALNILDREGHQIGIIQANLSLSYFSDFYAQTAQHQNAVISLFDQGGGLVVRTTSSTLQSEEPGMLEPALKARFAEPAREGYVLLEADLDTRDVGVVYSYRKLRRFPLVLVYQQDLRAVLAGWNLRVGNRLFFASVTAASILLLTVLLFLQIRHLRSSRERLAASERRYRQMFQGAQDAVLLINRSYAYVDCNQAALRLFGADHPGQVIGQRVGRFSEEKQTLPGAAEQDKDSLIPLLVDAAFRGEEQQFEWKTLRGGRTQYNEISLRAVEMEEGLLVFCTIRDINARKYSELLLKGQVRLLQLVSSEHELPYILDCACGFIESMSGQVVAGIQMLAEDQRSFVHACGAHLPELLKVQMAGMSLARGNGIWSEALLQGTYVESAALQQAPCMQFVRQIELLDAFKSAAAWPLMGKSGQPLGAFTLLFYSATIPLDDALRDVIRVTLEIVALAIEGRRSECKILQLAHYDELTGLPNRFLYNQHLNKSLAQAIRNQGRLAVLFLDLDRFKNINDTFGHDEGDQVLRMISARFKKALRDSDIIARVGGDEFILLIDQFRTPADLGEIAEKLLYEACQPFEIDGQECQLSASIGIATYPEDGSDTQTLLKNADIAMYRAKNRGKNNFQFYASEMNVHTVERLAFEARLRKALERREFVVHYQPKIDIATGRIFGAEALVRWNHPERGVLYPGEFITVAEEAGLVGGIGMLVLDIACRDIIQFRNINPHFQRVAINLSGAQFNDAGLLEEVKSVVDFWRVSAQAIEFEITESMVMHNREQAITLMDGLKAAGFTLSIDDFGTGYSSLAYLKRFPVDSVKIDRSFVKDIPDDANDCAIVRAIVALAHSLDLHVIAEGVETAEQLDILRTFQCDAYQGYHFSKPLNDQDFLRCLRQAQTRT